MVGEVPTDAHDLRARDDRGQQADLVVGQAITGGLGGAEEGVRIEDGDLQARGVGPAVDDLAELAFDDAVGGLIVVDESDNAHGYSLGVLSHGVGDSAPDLT